MIDKTTLDTRVRAILILCYSANKAKFGSPEYKQITKALWDAVFNLNQEARLNSTSVAEPGCFVQFPHLGGYARYIVMRVGKQHCKLFHIPWADGYKSRFVNDKNEVDTKMVEDSIEQEDRVSRLFQANAGERANALLFGMGGHDEAPFELHDVGRRGVANQPHP